MRALWCLALLAVAAPVAARDPLIGPKAHYYGPLKNWHGVGYKHQIQKDGSWRVLAESRINDGSGFAFNVAMYRTAELAREQGFRYVQLISGYGTRTFFGQESATVIARPSASPAQPTGCKPKRCYTADVATLLTMLGGPAGDQPGVAVPSYLDEYGHTVTITGFGIAAVSADGVVRPEPLPPGAKPFPTRVASGPAFVLAAAPPVPSAVGSNVAPAPVRALPPYRPSVADEPSFADRLRAAQPVRGGDKRQGWTISE